MSSSAGDERTVTAVFTCALDTLDCIINIFLRLITTSVRLLSKLSDGSPLMTEMSAPTASERKACWGARDELWRCLDLHEDQTSTCEKYLREFETKCPAQWVKYFAKRRDFLKYKEKIQNEGYEPTEGSPKL